MKRVSILSLHLNYGGIEKAIVSLANGLSDDFLVEIISVYEISDSPVFEVNEEVKIKYLLPKTLLPNKEAIKYCLKHHRFIKLFKELIKGIIVLIYRRKKTVKAIKECDSDYIISTRDIFNEWLSKFGNKQSIKIAWEHNHFQTKKYFNRIVNSVKKLDYFVVVSKGLKVAYQSALNNTNCKVLNIPNILNEYSRTTSKLVNKKLISVGRLSPEKGYGVLLEVFSQILVMRPNWKLEIIGDGPEREFLEKKAEQLKLNKTVYFSGFKDPNYINMKLEESSIYIMTSFTEAFGIVLLEAMNYGLPIIAFTSAEGAVELIQEGFNGHLVSNRDNHEMAKRVVELIDDESKRKKLGSAGKEYCLNFTNDVVIEKWKEILRKGE